MPSWKTPLKPGCTVVCTNDLVARILSCRGGGEHTERYIVELLVLKGTHRYSEGRHSFLHLNGHQFGIDLRFKEIFAPGEYKPTATLEDEFFQRTSDA